MASSDHTLRPRPRWKHSVHQRSFNLQSRSIQPRSLALLLSMLIFLITLIPAADAAFINFENCLDPSYKDADNPVRLQFVPLFLEAEFIHHNADWYTLDITAYGNVTGQSTVGPYPPPWDKSWSDDSDHFGKLVNFNRNENYTTLAASANVLSYTPWPRQVSAFCNATVNSSCPVGPAFYKNASNPFDLPAFRVSRDFTSSYALATFNSEISIISGDSRATQLACIRADITPTMGEKLANAFTYVPAAILIIVAIATVMAARFSPWSSPDPFYWSSNFGRDPDLLRLITPGFGDCLQYIQFIVLAGSLSLNYPGFYQPVVSRASWSTLMFNESFVSGIHGTNSLSNGVYFSNGSYGLTRMDQLVGMGDDSDAWAGMAVWLLVIIAIVVLVCQLWFLLRWISHRRHSEHGNDLRTKNIPFTSGMIVRLWFNYFNLPILSLSLFQLVIAPSSPSSVVACAVIMLFAFLACAGWIFRLIFTTKPRVQLFDHLPTLLAYGPLYNTYSDEAAPFAFIPVLLNFIRGAAIGAVQPSGIAQIVLLAICEVVFLLTLHAFRPFNAPTSMNAYHTFFSVIRLITTLLMIAFAPSLNVSQSTKGWTGYVILLLHAIVLIFGFFLNALQTLIEVAARSSSVGAGNRDARGGLAKVFGMRQLSKRAHRRHVRSSLTSDAAVLTNDDSKSFREAGRSRSLSASSAILLQRPMSNYGRDRTSTGLPDEWDEMGSPGPSTPGATSPFSHLNDRAPAGTRRGTFGSKGMEQGDAFYRPPRVRRPTLEAQAAMAGEVTDSNGLAAQPYKDSPDHSKHDSADGSSAWGSPPHRSSITPAFLRASHQSDKTAESNTQGGPGQNSTDYAVRESDFYYGVRRGPALNTGPSRRLKTGPADPVGPVSNATGWFKGLFGGAKKEKTKGFEVVRTPRYPLAALDEDTQEAQRNPYKDSPDGNNAAFEGQGADRSMSQHQHDGGIDAPQLLGPIDAGEELRMPSRVGSRSSTQSAQNRQGFGQLMVAPSVPRRSSKRHSSMGDASVMMQGRSSRSEQGDIYLHPTSPNQTRSSTRLPFGGADFAADTSSREHSPSSESRPNTRGSRTFRHSTASSVYPVSEGGTPIPGGEGAGVDDESMGMPSRGNTQRSTVNAGQDSRRGRSRGNSNVSTRQPEGERPVSTGRVGRHLASDSVRDAAVEWNNLRGSGRGWGGEEAEVVGGNMGAGSPGLRGSRPSTGNAGAHDDFQWAPR